MKNNKRLYTMLAMLCALLVLFIGYKTAVSMNEAKERKAAEEAAAGVQLALKIYVRQVWRRKSMMALSAAMKPPIEARLFEKVPMMRSTSLVQPK